jgi:hypothetical protein
MPSLIAMGPKFARLNVNRLDCGRDTCADKTQGDRWNGGSSRCVHLELADWRYRNAGNKSDSFGASKVVLVDFDLTAGRTVTIPCFLRPTIVDFVFTFFHLTATPLPLYFCAGILGDKAVHCRRKTIRFACGALRVSFPRKVDLHPSPILVRSRQRICMSVCSGIAGQRHVPTNCRLRNVERVFP